MTCERDIWYIQERPRSKGDLGLNCSDLQSRYGEKPEGASNGTLVRTPRQDQETRATDRMSHDDHSEVVESSLKGCQAGD